MRIIFCSTPHHPPKVLAPQPSHKCPLLKALTPYHSPKEFKKKTIPRKMSTVVQDNQDQVVVVDEQTSAEIVSDPEECYRRSVELLVELGFPKGVLPLKDLVECGRNRETGFVWMKQREPYEHYFEKTGTRVSYATEVTSYVEKGRMKRMTGVKSRQMLLWVTISEMSLEERPGGRTKIMFKTPMGIGKSFPASAFMTEEEEREKLLLEGGAYN